MSHPAGDIVDLMRRVKSFETMRPLEVFGTTKTFLGTDYDVPHIPNSAALDRLSNIGFGDETQISALRIGGQPRLWGFRRDAEFYPVFWDPLHEIYPSPKKHT